MIRLAPAARSRTWRWRMCRNWNTRFANCKQCSVHSVIWPGTVTAISDRNVRSWMIWAAVCPRRLRQRNAHVAVEHNRSMKSWLHLLLSFSLLWNALALPWAQSPCPHRLLADAAAATAPPCHSHPGQQNDLSKSTVADRSCGCGCILHALPSFSVALVAVIPAAEQVSAPGARGVGPLPRQPPLRPPIA
jgi:hypothetical protein